MQYNGSYRSISIKIMSICTTSAATAWQCGRSATDATFSDAR